VSTNGSDLQERAAIDEAVATFDGAHVAPLGAVAADMPATPSILDHLIDLCFASGENAQIAASWLLKNYLEQGAKLAKGQNVRIADGLPQVGPWQARLHFAQSFRWIDCGDSRSAETAQILSQWFQSEHKFLRAWACDAIWRLGQRYDPLRQLAIDTALAAEADPAASVRARARNLLKLK
jgi:hypothetical protein